MRAIMELLTKNLKETEDFARLLAPKLKQLRALTLEGDLGAGKTTFTRYLVSCLASDFVNEVTSPTFSYVHILGDIAHFDLYRLNSIDPLFELGLDEILLSDKIKIVEWPVFALPFLPKNRLHLRIETVDETTRKWTLSGGDL